MKLKKLGRTDIEVSQICLGSMTWVNGSHGDRQIGSDPSL